MHAARILSLKRKHSLERQRSRGRLQRGFTNGDLSRTDLDSAGDSPWYVSKWDERKSAFKEAKSAKGLTLFHMFALVALLGVGLMVGSFFVGPAAGLLEIGVSALLFSLFCLIFVRCDGSGDDDQGHKFSDTRRDPGLSGVLISKGDKGDPSSDNAAQTLGDDENDEEVRQTLLLTRSNPRKIPSPLRVFGYELNFSPIPELSEPSSSVSSFMPRNMSVASRLANSSTNDSLSRVSSKASCGVGGGRGGSPINEVVEDDDDDDDDDEDQLRLKLDLIGPREDYYNHYPPEDDPNNPNSSKLPEVDWTSEDPLTADLLSLSASNLSVYSANTASFDTDESTTADLSVVTVIERGGANNNSSSNKGYGISPSKNYENEQ